jgi:quinol monooxygenase YgiN
MYARITRPLLGLALTLNAYAQEPSTPASGAAAAPPPTAFFIKFKVKPGRNADFEKAIAGILAGVRETEPGNVYCDLLHPAQDPQTYVIMERYKNIEASKAHAESPYMQKARAALSDLLDGAPEVQDLVFIRSK